MATLYARVGWPKAFSSKVGAAVIKLAQPSPVYHVGLLLADGYLYQARLQQGVYRQHLSKEAQEDPDWLKVECPWVDETSAFKYYMARVGREYDLLGLADWAFRRAVLTLTGEAIRPGLQDPRREICSEFVAGMLGFEQPIRWSPSAILRACEARVGE